LEKITVFYSNKVQIYFDDLILNLFKKDYFIYEENAIHYVEKLVLYIEENIAIIPHKKTMKSLSKYGDFYILYQSNARTTWYIFFSKKEAVYLIKYISNNHTFDAKYINQL